MVRNEQLIDHDLENESRIFQKFADIKKKKNYLCENCRKHNPEIQKINDGRPVSFFTVGADMDKLKNKLMFVAKTVTYNWGGENNPDEPVNEVSGFIDARYSAEKMFLEQRIFLFKRIAEICQTLWKDEKLDLKSIWRRVAVTNFTKCSNSDKSWEEETTENMKDNCLATGFLEAEIEEVKPTHLIFFTGPSYDKQIKKLLELKNEIIDESNDKNRKWWIGKSEQNKIRTNILRINHPNYIQFFPSEEKRQLYQQISSWIREG